MMSACPPSDPSTLVNAQLLELTVRAVERRVRIYRLFSLAVGLFCVGIVLSAVFLRTGWPFAAFLLLVPVVAIDIAIDRRVVQGWARETLAFIETGRVTLDECEYILRAHPSFPAATLTGMLTELEHATHTAAQAVMNEH